MIYTLNDLFNYAVNTYENVSAIKYFEGNELITKTYAEVGKDVYATLHSIGTQISKGAHVGILCPNSYNWVLAFWSICTSGRVFVPLNAGLLKDELIRQIKYADVEAVMYDKQFTSLVQNLKNAMPECIFICVDTICLDGTTDLNDLSEGIGVSEGQLCGIVFTSGTSAEPKAVMLSHGNLVDNAKCADMKLPAGTRSLSILPLYHLYGITMDYIRGFLIGLTICINDKIEKFSRNMRYFQPQAICAVPMIVTSMLNKMKQLQRKGLAKAEIKGQIFGDSLEVIYCAGAHLDQSVVDEYKEWGIIVCTAYGMTECSPAIATNFQWDVRPFSVGRPVKKCSIKIENDEIVVKSPSVMLGYYKETEATDAVLQNGWLKTGDIGYIDSDGYLYVTGRKKNVIILSSGENISPEKIEELLLKNSEILEVIVEQDKHALKARIFPNYTLLHGWSKDDITGRCQEIIDSYNTGKTMEKSIQQIDILEKPFPKSASGKIIRRKKG